MKIYELNPGDLVKIEPASYRVNLFRRDIKNEIFEVYYIKLNDSFPRVIVQVPMIEKQKDIHGNEFITKENYIDYSVDASEITVMEHPNRNNKRWSWIVNRIGIGDNYPTLYYSAIAKNEYARFNWQTWGDDGFYHCPFCDKPLNTVDEIEETPKEDTTSIALKSCDCEDWLKRAEKYEKYLKAQAKMKKLENDILKNTEIVNKRAK